MALTATPVRKCGSLARYTNLPKVPQNTAVAVDGDVYPCDRLVRRASMLSSTSVVATWIAQTNNGATKCVITSAEDTLVRGIACDPTLVNYAAVTRTYQRPRNPNGGIPKYSFSLGTATLKAGAVTLATQAISEDRQPLLAAVNTWAEVRKLPPICVTQGSLTGAILLEIYETGNVGFVTNGVTAPSPRALRYLGGQVAVTITIGDGSTLCTVYAVPITAGSNPTDDWSVRVAIGTITAILNTPVTRIFTEAEMLAATVVRWEQYWIFATRVSGTPGLSLVSYKLYSPVDVPPPYDAPGVDGLIPGGYLS